MLRSRFHPLLILALAEDVIYQPLKKGQKEVALILMQGAQVTLIQYNIYILNMTPRCVSYYYKYIHLFRSSTIP